MLNLSVLRFSLAKSTQQGYLLPGGEVGLRGRRGQLRSQYQVQEEWMRERPGSKRKKSIDFQGKISHLFPVKRQNSHLAVLPVGQHLKHKITLGLEDH